MGIDEAKEHLRRFGKDTEVIEFAESSATVELAAKALGVEPGRIAKTLSFAKGDAAHLVLFAGDARVDNAKYKARFGAKASMLAPDVVLARTGHRVGGVCPFGLAEALDVWLDESLKRFEHVYPACGSGNSAIRCTLAELELWSGAKGWIDVSKPPTTAGEGVPAVAAAAATEFAAVNLSYPRGALAEELELYRKRHPEEVDIVDRLIQFVKSRENSFSRDCESGHITGSAFIVDRGLGATLFVHHKKLDKWLQPGGHCEPGESAIQAAIREAFEETGVLARPFFEAAPPTGIFDVDIHSIPERAGTPAHLHYDIRFLLMASRGDERASEESHAVEWLELDEAERRNPEKSIKRPMAKLRALRGQLSVSSERGESR